MHGIPPLMENCSKYKMQDPTLKESVDLTTDQYETAISTDTISQLTQDLSFLRKESIKIINDKKDVENASFLDKISSLQKSADTSIGTLSTFIKGTLASQDAVITSLKNGQESMDNRMTTVTDNFKKQMDAMYQSLVNLQHTLLSLVGVSSQLDLMSAQQRVIANMNKDNTFTGTQPGEPGELRALISERGDKGEIWRIQENFVRIIRIRGELYLRGVIKTNKKD